MQINPLYKNYSTSLVGYVEEREVLPQVATECATCTLTAILQSDKLLTPNNKITSEAMQALMWDGEPTENNMQGWRRESYGWEYNPPNSNSKICFSSDDSGFGSYFAQNPKIVDIAVMSLIAGAYAFQHREDAYISERGLYRAWEFSSFGQKRRNLKDAISSTVKIFSSLKLSYEGLPSGNKRKPLKNTDDFLVHLTPASTTGRAPHAKIWRIELGQWAHTYLNPKHFVWLSSLPRQTLALATHINSQRIAKYLAYSLLGFPGGTHHFKEGVTNRTIRRLLLALGEAPKPNSSTGVRNCYRHIKQDVDRAFAVLCQQGVMQSVEYDPFPNLSRFWSSQWLNATVKFTYNT